MKTLILFLILFISSCSIQEQVRENHCTNKPGEIIRNHFNCWCGKGEIAETVYVKQINNRVWLIPDSLNHSNLKTTLHRIVCPINYGASDSVYSMLDSLNPNILRVK